MILVGQFTASFMFPPSRPKIVLLLLKTFGSYNQSSGQAATLTNWVPGFFQCWFKIGCSRICQCMGSPISLQGQEGECGKQFHAARKWKYQSQLKWVESVISKAAKLYLPSLYQLVWAKNMHSVRNLSYSWISCRILIKIWWFAKYSLAACKTFRGNQMIHS